MQSSDPQLSDDKAVAKMGTRLGILWVGLCRNAGVPGCGIFSLEFVFGPIFSITSVISLTKHAAFVA